VADWILAEDAAPTTVTEADTTPVPSLEEQLAEATAQLAIVSESYADLQQLYIDDVGWRRIGEERTRFTAQGRAAIAAVADLFASGNALIKSGIGLRTAYVWGQGVDVVVRDDPEKGQDVNAVWRAFWDDKSTRRIFSSSEAQVRYERKLATTGEVFWALPTEPLTGRVRVRRIPPNEITDRVCDPEDAETVWYYLRVWNAVVIDPTSGRRTTVQRRTAYPALGYYPPVRPDKVNIDGAEAIVRWDAPMRHVAVNCADEDWRGQGDVLAALPWAKLDKEFLEDLAVYMRVLTKILGQVTARSRGAAERAQAALSEVVASHPQGIPPGGPGAGRMVGAGGWAVTDPNTTMQIMSKSGAQIDSNSSKPFASRAAAALAVPLTMLLGDPGTTGARATAETLDQPTELAARLRQEVHTELFRDIADYVIDQAIIAPAGPLHGSLSRDGDALVATLPDDDVRTVEVSWPEYDSTPINVLVAAIAEADTTGKIPPETIARLLLAAFGVDDIDDLIDRMTDENNQFIDQKSSAGQAAANKFRAGNDPAADFT